MSQELYMCSFKNEFSNKTPDECFKIITEFMELKCTEDEITKLSITYTSLGELFEIQLYKNSDKNLFNYIDLIYKTDTTLFEKKHKKFIFSVLNNMRNSTSCDFTSFMKIGFIAIIGDKLNINEINKNSLSTFHKNILSDFI